MDLVAQSVPAARCGSVPLPARTPGGTPGELAGEDACATSPPVRFRGSKREILFRRILTRQLGWAAGCIALAVTSNGRCDATTNCAATPSGLVSWWRGENSTADAADGNTGTIAGTGTVNYGPGVVGQAFVFDGTHRDRVNIGNPTSLRLEDFTLEAWVKRSSPTVTSFDVLGADGSVTGDSGYIFGYGRGGYCFAIANDGRMVLSRVDLDGLFTSPLVTDTNWHHLAVTKSGSNAVFYVDGAPQVTPAYVHPAPYTFDDATCDCSAAAAIGSRGDARGGTFFGMIDEPAVFNRALAAAEIQAIYAAGSAGKCVVSNPPPPLPPVIVSPPTNLTVYVGSNATFRVTATGDAPLSYQWRFSNTNLPGKISNELSFTSVQLSSAGPYSVVVSNAGGSVTSSNAVLTVRPLPPCASVNAGLVSWWRAEKDSMDNWDSNNGTAPQGLTTTSGKVGQAFSFVRPGFILVNDSPALRPTNALTVETWVNPSSVSAATPSTIVSKFDYPLTQPVGTNSSFFLGLTNSGRVIFSVSATGSVGTVTSLVTAQPVPNNQWTHVAATYDGVHVRIYINGALSGSKDHFGGIFPGTANLSIGAIPSPTPAAAYFWQFTGLLDEISLYNRALTDGEIQAIFNADVVGKCLVGPTIVTPPQNQAVPLGEDVKFTVAVLGSRPLQYQWRFNNAVIAGATDPALVLEKVKTNQAGFYHVAVTNAAGFAISGRAQLSLLPAPACTDLPAGLISWWPFDGNSADAMGTNNATLVEQALYVTGKVDRAVSLNGTSARIQVNNSASLNFGSNADFSIEMWIKAGASNAVNSNVPLFEKKDGTTAWVGYSLSLNQGRLAFAMGSSPANAANVSTFISPGPDLRDAMFHHVAVSVNRTATNGGNLYVDGQLVLTFNPTPRKGSLIAGTPLYLGAPSSTTSNSYFGGLIDEPAIYSRALTASEILALRQAGAAGKCKVKPSILVQPVSQRVTVGSNVTFSVTAAGSPALRYQWFRTFTDLGIIPGATNSAYTISNVSTITYAGPFSVRVTNLFGSVFSSNVLLTVNHVPAAFPQTLSLNEDTPTPITLIGSDPDHDPLIYTLVTPPAHGALSGTGSNVVYTPSPNYNGPDSFTFKVNDGLVDSAPASVGLTILPVNDPPAAQSQSVTLDEDTPTAITLGAFDVDGDSLAFTVGAPSHGTLTGTPPNLTYRPNTNYFGPDSFTFSVSDGQTNSDIATVSITVRPVNDPPVAQIVLAPLSHLPGVTNLLVIAPVGTNAVVFLDGSRSTDVENDPLTYSWREGTTPFATGVLATNRFAPGLHVITLTVSDGQATGTNSVVLEVLSSAQAVGTLMDLVENADLGGRNANALLATLQNAADSFERGKATAGLNELEAFQNKVRAQIAPLDPALAAALIEAAQEIIDALSAPAAPRPAGNHLAGPARQPGGKFQLRFNAPPGRTYFIQASTNLVTWEIIGVARDVGQNVFDFEDVHALQFPDRYYRVVSW